MNKIYNLSIFFIGFCFTFLVYNKIAFGISLSIGILTLLTLQRKSVTNEFIEVLKKSDRNNYLIFILFISSSIISCMLSIQISKSFPVIVYLTLFIFFSLLLFIVLKDKKELKISLFKTLTLSLTINSVLIFVYNITNYNFFELIRFKGVMNVITLLTFLNFYFNKSKLNLIPLILLIPNIYMTGSSSSILGIISGLSLCLIYFISKKFLKISIPKSFFLLLLSSLVILIAIFFSKALPTKFDTQSVKKYEFSIPLKIIDGHRQFIWGFSIEKFKQKPLFGYGQDTSNFIEGSQKVIGNYFTGDMTFIPSHPHNFLIELLLETGIIGTLLFIFFLFKINQNVWRISSDEKFKLFLIFFNIYFWSSSLVNFSFWQGWWQGSYFLLLSFISSKAFSKGILFTK